MNNYTKQYINGEWVDSTSGEYIDVINPATEEVFGRIAKGNKEDVDKAVKAADSVYLKFRNMPVEDKKSMLDRIVVEYEKRKDDIMIEMKSEISISKCKMDTMI